MVAFAAGLALDDVAGLALEDAGGLAVEEPACAANPIAGAANSAAARVAVVRMLRMFFSFMYQGMLTMFDYTGRRR